VNDRNDRRLESIATARWCFIIPEHTGLVPLYQLISALDCVRNSDPANDRSGSKVVLLIQLLQPQNRVRNTPVSRHDGDGSEHLRAKTGRNSTGLKASMFTRWYAGKRQSSACSSALPVGKYQN